VKFQIVAENMNVYFSTLTTGQYGESLCLLEPLVSMVLAILVKMLFKDMKSAILDLFVFRQSLALPWDSSSVDCPHVSRQLEIRQFVVTPDKFTCSRRCTIVALHVLHAPDV